VLDDELEIVAINHLFLPSIFIPQASAGVLLSKPSCDVTGGNPTLTVEEEQQEQ
jgi:hypothetical protein